MLLRFLAIIFLLLAGPACAQQTQTFSTYMKGLPTASTPLSGAETTLVLQSGTVKQIPVISIPATALNLTQTMSGSATLYNWNALTTTSDTQGCDFCTDFNITHMFGGAIHRGAHENIFSWSIQTSPNSGSGTTVGIGITGIGQTNSGDGGTGTGNATAKGTYFGANFIGASSATNVYETIGAEFDLQTTGTSTQRYGFGLSSVNIESTQAAVADAGIVFYSGGPIAAAGGGGPWGPGVGFHNGILFAELGNNGLVPIDSSGSVLSTHLETLSNIPVSYGIDLRGFAVTNCAFASTNFCVTGAGQVTAQNLTISATTTTLHLVGIASAPPNCSATGIGGAGTCTMATGSNDLSGQIVLNAATGAGQSGTAILNLNSPVGTNNSNCIFQFTTGTGSWNSSGPGLISTTSSTQSATLFWSNGGGASLTPGSSYGIGYHCIGY